MKTGIFATLAFLAAIGTSSTAIFAGTWTEEATPPNVKSNDTMLFVTSDLAKQLGFQKDLNVPAVPIDIVDIRQWFQKDILEVRYALVDKKAALGLYMHLTGQIKRAEEGSFDLDKQDYAIAMVGAETLKGESQYGELIDRELSDDVVLIMIVGPKVASVIIAAGIVEDQILDDTTADLLRTFTDKTLDDGTPGDQRKDERKLVEA